MTQPNWGPAGETVYERTYQRKKQDGTKETWRETVDRVVRGNLSLVYGDITSWPPAVSEEAVELAKLMYEFKVLPAGRHLWASGVPGRQYLFNCHVSGWGEKFSDHFEFSFMRLMEGGGVGANYSSGNLYQYGAVRRPLKVHVVCDPSHPDYNKLKSDGLLSDDYSFEWPGAFPVEDSREGWASALVDLLDTYMTDDDVKHTNRVYDISRVRPEGQPLRTFGGSASGPVPMARMLTEISVVMNRSEYLCSFVTPIQAMEIDHAIAKCVVSGGVRRSARMSILPWDDPYIQDFINCKSDLNNHWTTNISVAIDNTFIEAVEDVYGHGEVGKRADAILRAISEGMLKNGEPGFWNQSLSNINEPNLVTCTNPCGEIALQEWENCNLGHINMDAFSPRHQGGSVDVVGMLRAHQLMARFLIRATFGDVTDNRQQLVAKANRRIGVGHFGVQGFLVKQGIKFTKAPENIYFTRLLRQCYKAVRDEARSYAFTLRIPEPVKVTTVAPTGSVAKLPGRTEGIHPVYARHFIRRVRFSTVDPDQWLKVLSFIAQGYKAEPCLYAPNTYAVEFPTEESLVGEVREMGLDPELIESAAEIPLERMLAFQALYQREYADNAVSFTVNFPEGSLPVLMVMLALRRYLPKLKGTTLMPDGSRVQAPYERITEEEYHSLTGPKVVSDSVDDTCATGACPVR
jgi:adenosylcobalamin-dependent ribonucleoside-triphosphate reductase